MEVYSPRKFLWMACHQACFLSENLYPPALPPTPVVVQTQAPPLGRLGGGRTTHPPPQSVYNLYTQFWPSRKKRKRKKKMKRSQRLKTSPINPNYFNEACNLRCLSAPWLRPAGRKLHLSSWSSTTGNVIFKNWQQWFRMVDITLRRCFPPWQWIQMISSMLLNSKFFFPISTLKLDCECLCHWWL